MAAHTSAGRCLLFRPEHNGRTPGQSPFKRWGTARASGVTRKASTCPVGLKGAAIKLVQRGGGGGAGPPLATSQSPSMTWCFTPHVNVNVNVNGQQPLAMHQSLLLACSTLHGRSDWGGGGLLKTSKPCRAKTF